MYQKQPTITEELSHEQLLQLMLLADRFEVPKVQAAVAAAFSTVQPQQLEWQTALQLLDLPPSCAQQAEFKAVQQLAVQRLQQQLGDLEEVWADEQKQQQLLSLPFSALLQLLQHADTCVASENTVVYTIEKWCTALPASAGSVEQLKQLMHLVRVQHCTSCYAGTVMPQSVLVQHCFDQSELLLMHVCCASGVHAKLQAQALSPALKKYPAWGAEQRPASAKQPMFEWQLPLGTVQAAVEKHLSSSSSTATVVGTSSFHIVQGQPAAVHVQVHNSSGGSSDGGARALALGVFLKLSNLPSNAVRQVSAKLALVAAPAAAAAGGGQAAAETPSWSFHNCFVSSEQCWGFPQFISLGAEGSWEAAEAVLRQKQLVHAGGQGDAAAGPHLLVQVEVPELL